MVVCWFRGIINSSSYERTFLAFYEHDVPDLVTQA